MEAKKRKAGLIEVDQLHKLFLNRLWRTVLVIILIDFIVQLLTGKEVRLIYSVLKYLFT